jgi:ketosteroid isomerase-like protein
MQTINLYLLAGILALAAPAYMAAHGSDAARKNTIKKEALAGPVRAKTNLTSRVIKMVAVGDVALVYTGFEGTSLDASGKKVESRFNAIEVPRRQGDGGWKLIVREPNGRE